MKIITLTINPALDKSAQVDALVPHEKLNSYGVVYHPGGGGINISRVLHRLKIKNDCLFPYGGKTGEHIVALLNNKNINVTALPIDIVTRENFAVLENKTGFQYRFGMPTADFVEKDLAPLEDKIINLVAKGDILVISGSLPRGLPDDYYANLIKKMKAKNVKVILDTSGAAFKNTLEEPLFLIKPNHHELSILAGTELTTRAEQEAFAMQMIHQGNVSYVVVSLGKDGAFMAHKNGIETVRPPKIEVKSTIGAGDSMVAGLIYGIVNELTPKEILTWGVACGAAATLNPGADLAHRKEVLKILKQLAKK